MKCVKYILLATLLAPSIFAAESKPGVQFALSRLSKDEISIVARLQSLREATEKLPADWKATALNPGESELTKADLLAQVTEMEVSAAERWNTLINNMAIMESPRPELDEQQVEWRVKLKELAKRHREMNLLLDKFNARLKEGILLNLARKIQVSSTSIE